MMKRLLLGAVVLVMAACGRDGADAFRQGVPTSEAVALKLPGKANALSGEGTRRDGLEGQTADFYRTTRDVAGMVNSGTSGALDLVHHITQYPATSATEDTAVWGPHTEPLSPTTWKLTVTRTAPDTYAYRFEGKAKTEPDSAFRVILSGTHQDLGALIGAGQMVFDFTLASQLPDGDGKVGRATITYSRPSLGATTQIDADFEQVRDGAALIDAQYRYWSTPGQGGSMEFAMQKDIVQGTGIENAQIRSRWQETGAGRADVKVTGGDVNAPVTINECWDAGFASRYLHVSYDASASYGAESVCAFTAAEYASL